MACDLARSGGFGLGRVHGMQPDPLERTWPWFCSKSDWWDYWTERQLTRRHEIMKQGSAEQLAENERRCKWSATLAALARVPVGKTIEFPHIALSETNRLRSVLHTSGRTSHFRWSVSSKTGDIRVSKIGHWTGVTEH